MSDNALSLFSKNKLPAYIQNLGLDDTTKALMGGGGGKRISIRGGVFRKVVGGKEVMKNEERAMNVVIVRSAPHVARTYYEGTYVEGSSTPPVCWSSDGEAPDKDVKQKQSDICATCPMNVAGSGQGDSRACRFSQRVAVVLDGDLEGDVMQLSLPAQSLFGKGENGTMPLQQYVRFLAGHQVPVTAVITEMKFDTDSATPKLTFKPIRPLTEDEYKVVQEQAETQDAIDAVTFSVHAMDTAVGTGNSEADAANADALKGAIKTEAKAEDKPKRTRRTKAEIEADAEEEAKQAAARAAEKAKAEAAAKAAAEDDDDEEDEDDEDDEEAELMRKLAEAKAKKEAKAKAKAAEKAKASEDEEAPRVRGADKAEAAAPTDAAAVMAAWADDDDDTDD